MDALLVSKGKRFEYSHYLSCYGCKATKYNWLEQIAFYSINDKTIYLRKYGVFWVKPKVKPERVMLKVDINIYGVLSRKPIFNVPQDDASFEFNNLGQIQLFGMDARLSYLDSNTVLILVQYKNQLAIKGVTHVNMKLDNIVLQDT